MGPPPGGAAQVGEDEPPICWVAPGQRCCFPGFSLSLHSSLLSIPFSPGPCLSSPSPLLGLAFSPSSPTTEQSRNQQQSPGWMNPLAPRISGTIIVSRRAARCLPALLFSAIGRLTICLGSSRRCRAGGFHPGRVGLSNGGSVQPSPMARVFWLPFSPLQRPGLWEPESFPASSHGRLASPFIAGLPR